MVWPSSILHIILIPRDAAAARIPWSLFLYNHVLPSGVIRRSLQKPAFTKALTKVAASFARAESTLGALVLDAREDAESPRWLLYISSGVFASRISRSRPRSA